MYFGCTEELPGSVFQEFAAVEGGLQWLLDPGSVHVPGAADDIINLFCEDIRQEDAS